MNITQLEYLITAVEAGSYSSASKKLFVNPSTISLAISSLENELDIRLLERSPAGITLTSDGRAFYEKACVAAVSFSRLKEFSVIRKSDECKRLTLNVAVYSTNARGCLIGDRVLESFANKYPNTEMNIYRNTNQECLEFLNESLVEIAVVSDSDSFPNFCADRVLFRKIGVLANETLFGSENGIRICDILEAPIAMPSGIGYVYKKITTLFSRHIAKPNFIDVASSKEAVVEFVNRGGVVFVIQDATLRKEYPSLRVLPLDPVDDFLVPALVVTKDVDNNPIVPAFKSHLSRYSRIK